MLRINELAGFWPSSSKGSDPYVDGPFYLAVGHKNPPYLTFLSRDLMKCRYEGPLPTNIPNRMELSPDGRFLALSFGSAPYLYVFHTTDWSLLTLDNLFTNAYGLVFSSDSNYLYIGWGQETPGGGKVSRFDLNSEITSLTQEGFPNIPRWLGYLNNTTGVAMTLGVQNYNRFNPSNLSDPILSYSLGNPGSAMTDADFKNNRIAISHSYDQSSYAVYDLSANKMSSVSLEGSGSSLRYLSRMDLLVVGMNFSVTGNFIRAVNPNSNIIYPDGLFSELPASSVLDIKFNSSENKIAFTFLDSPYIITANVPEVAGSYNWELENALKGRIAGTPTCLSFL